MPKYTSGVTNRCRCEAGACRVEFSEPVMTPDGGATYRVIDFGSQVYQDED